jgi:hypothetical protein
MSKARARKTGKSSKSAQSAAKKPLKHVELGPVQEHITNLVGNRAIKMVETTIAEVNKGHYLAMKYLFEMIGLFPATTSEEPIQDDSLAKTLMQRLGLPEETSPGTEVMRECVADEVEQESDAVK